jgi:hypothetical protein
MLNRLILLKDFKIYLCRITELFKNFRELKCFRNSPKFRNLGKSKTPIFSRLRKYFSIWGQFRRYQWFVNSQIDVAKFHALMDTSWCDESASPKLTRNNVAELVGISAISVCANQIYHCSISMISISVTSQKLEGAGVDMQWCVAQT